MRSYIEKMWYQPSLTCLVYFLLPFSWLFRSVIFIRRFLYQQGIKKSLRLPVPIIVVGNITVGGTGKTPLVIWLVKLLQAKGYAPGVISRGVGGRKQLIPVWMQADSKVEEVGDEAVLLSKRTACPVVVCVDRVAAAQALLSKGSVDIIVSDDGLQHYRLARDIEIIMIDGMRGFGNQQLLPAGPLREPMDRIKSADFIVKQVSQNFVESSSDNTMLLKGDTLVAVKDDTVRIPLSEFNAKRVHAVAAIGNPQRFFALLREQGFEVIEHQFVDHYLFTQQDLQFADDLPVIMTEKDAVKCVDIADERCWYIPVDAMVKIEFVDRLLKQLTKISVVLL